ncbi:MAG: methyltransferase domain-containing protein [Gemmatimonadaceae bacterium]|nr:methyltransferase domain-containing protein [Acetobacteraceae bacterium]
MDRREKLLSGLDLARQTGLEVGALHNPLVRRADGDIRYVDYADTAYLRHRYRDDPNVAVENIVDVDYVWGAKSMAEAVGGAKFDYAIASHVVEHVPDLIAWLEELHSVLRPGATLRLAVPDRRYTFDVLRQESPVSAVITANLLRARAPLPAQIIDSCMNHQAVDGVALWTGAAAALPRNRPAASLSHALMAARESLETSNYIDVHCWVFTPLSFLRILEQLCAFGLIRFECERCFDTPRGDFEFIVVLRASEDQARCIESWRNAADALRATPDPQVDALAAALRDATHAFQESTHRQSAEIARLQEGMAQLERRAAPLTWLARRAVARVRRARA